MPSGFIDSVVVKVGDGRRRTGRPGGAASGGASALLEAVVRTHRPIQTVSDVANTFETVK
jgi:hypothetical protein